MVMNIVAVIALALVATILCKLLDPYDKSYATCIALGAGVSIMLMLFTYISPIADTVSSLFSRAALDSAYLEILFKALGICYITQFAYDICKDSGENAIATQIELTGKISLLILALPLFKSLTDVVMRLTAL